MTTPNFKEINIADQVNEIKRIFESDKSDIEINSAVMTKMYQYEQIVSDIEDSYKKDYAGKFSRLKKFFSSSKKQDHENFKFHVIEYTEKFKSIKERIYNELKNNKRINAPDTDSKEITQEIYFQQRKLESVEDEIEGLEKKIKEIEKKITQLRRELNNPRISDDDKKAKNTEVQNLEKEKSKNEMMKVELEKLKKEVEGNIKELKKQRTTIIASENHVPILFSQLIKRLENCIAKLQKLQNAFIKKGSFKPPKKTYTIGFVGPEPDGAAVSDSAARARAHASLTESDKAKKSENVKKYNVAVKKLTWLRLVFSDSAKEKIENINKLAKVQRRKLSITDDWTENYSKINNFSKLFYDSRIEFLSGEKDVPGDFQEIYDSADKYYKNNKDICDMLCSNQKLDMRNLYIYDNNMGTELISGGKFKIPANYKYSQYLKCLASLIQTNQYNNSSSYTMNLQKCSDIINGKEVTILYDHDKGSWGSPYWVVVDNNGKSIGEPNAGETINKSITNEPAQKEVELVIRASNIAGGWLNLKNFS